jgi:TPR repeat protein
MKRLLILCLCTASLIIASDNKKFSDEEYQQLMNRCKESDSNEYYQTLFLFWGIASYKLGDRSQAEFFFEKSAAIGGADGAYYKARMIEKHHTDSYKIERALEWYRMAEERGHSHAQRDVNRLITKRKELRAQKAKL